MRTSALKLVLAFALYLVLPACASVRPGPDAGLPRVSRPVFNAVALTGLTVRAERVAGSSASVTTGTLSSHNVTYAGPYTANTYGYGTHTSVRNSTHYELYDSDELLKDLRRRIEDGGIARRVTPNANVRIEGRRVRGRTTTGIGTMTWDVLNCGSLLGLIGTPCLGSTEAEVELRVYHRDELVGTYHGVGTATWSHPIYGIVPAVRRMRRSSMNVATAVAARAALRNLIENPPRLTGASMAGTLPAFRP